MACIPSFDFAKIRIFFEFVCGLRGGFVGGGEKNVGWG
jgi:hypothetical protein